MCWPCVSSFCNLHTNCESSLCLHQPATSRHHSLISKSINSSRTDQQKYAVGQSRTISHKYKYMHTKTHRNVLCFPSFHEGWRTPLCCLEQEHICWFGAEKSSATTIWTDSTKVLRTTGQVRERICTPTCPVSIHLSICSRQYNQEEERVQMVNVSGPRY